MAAVANMSSWPSCVPAIERLGAPRLAQWKAVPVHGVAWVIIDCNFYIGLLLLLQASELLAPLLGPVWRGEKTVLEQI